MRDDTGKRSRLGGETEAAGNRWGATETKVHRRDVPLEPPPWPLADLDGHALRVDGTFVVVVENRGPGTGYRRRPYLTAKAAENAARKAQERGENVVVYLAELRPLWRLSGGAGR